MQNYEELFSFERLPFLFRVLSLPHNEGLPDTLKISMGVNTKTGTLIQKEDPEISVQLEAAYLSGTSFSGKLDEKGNGREYADDFIRYIMEICTNVNKKEILEVGCGNGYLLWRLKALGAETLGFEPGKSGGESYDVAIIDDFFPSTQVNKKFDIIITYAVFEHIANIEGFLSSVKNALKKDGMFIIGVPDCEDYINNGDISMLFHQHYNYFTKKTLTATLELNGFYIHDCSYSKYGRVLHCACCSNNKKNKKEVEINTDYTDFISAYLGSLTKIKDILIRHQNESVGVYVPGRIINYLEVLRSELNFNNIRFFDDSATIADSYYPGFDIPVESREQLISNPVDVLLIMFAGFCDKIAKEVRTYCAVVE